MGSTGRKFICGKCNSKSLTLTNSFDLGPDHRSDERILQIIVCTSCGLKGIAVYEESRRGSFESESWSHTGYIVSVEGFNQALWIINNKKHDAKIIDLIKKTTGSFNMRFN